MKRRKNFLKEAGVLLIAIFMVFSTVTIAVGNESIKKIEANIENTNRGRYWDIYTVDNTGSVGGFTSIAIDSSDHRHISYYDYIPNYNLKYAYSDGSTWNTYLVDDSANDVGQYTSIAIDSSNRPHISYYDYTLGALKYAYYDGSIWHDQIVAYNFYQFSSIAIDPYGNPHISYCESTNWDLKYASYTGSTWHHVTVDAVGDVGFYNSLAFSPSGYPHISYMDGTGGFGDLKYAYYDGKWHVYTVDSVGTVGQYTSIALEGGHPHISYYAYFPNQEVRYAYHDGSIWYYENADEDTDDVGKFTSIALDSRGNPHISYYDENNNTLKYTFKTPTGWHSETVDSNWGVGTWTSIALDSNDIPHISYYDWANDNLKYTYLYYTPSPPGGPYISGIGSGKPGITYDFTFKSVDSDDEDVMYFIDWDDGNFDETDYYASGEDVIVSHTWREKGDYVIRAKAIDYYGSESEWTEFPVTMPRNRVLFDSLFLWLIEQFPILQTLLQRFVLQ